MRHVVAVRLRHCVAALSIGLLAGCGGGGSSAPAASGPTGTTPPPVTPPVTPPSLTSSISPASGSVQVNEGEVGQLTFTVTVTGTTSGASVPVASVDGIVVNQQGPIDTSVTNQYVVHIATLPSVAHGTYNGAVVFRLCSDATCATIYAGSQQLFSYTATVKQAPVSDWATFQRDAGHTGFVNATLDPSKFATAWTWSRPAGDNEPIGGINSVATGAGKVFVTKDIYFGTGAVFALDETDGSQTWTYSLGPMASGGPAAFAGNTVYAPSTDQSANCNVWAIDATTGLYKFKMPSQCQWSAFLAPTVQGTSIFNTAQGGNVYSYATVNGALQWSALASAYDQSTPAVDSRYAYQYGTTVSGAALHVFDRATGVAVATIDDPFYPGSVGYSMFSAPMLGSTGNAITFSGFGFSGRAASSSEQFEQRVLVDYDVAHQTIGWRTANAYITHPAMANGVVYAARNAPASLDALSEVDGHLLWSWPLPAADTSFHRNIVVTNNLVFVSTDANVYAVDLTTHQAVWHYPKPGMLAISGNLVLYIVTGATISDGNLVAVKLR